MEPSTDNMKALLLEELSHENVNILRVRKLCRDTPGLIASAGLRVRCWSLLLLGHTEVKNANEEIGEATEECIEQHVLENDVKRTRGDVEDFRSTAFRAALTNILQNFCLKHCIQYKQGMNEVAAPFIFCHPPSKGTSLPFALFEAFLFRYLERYFCVDESMFLFKAFRLFHILLVYHDPQLALHLHENNFPPELYAPQWFLTLYSRALPLPLVLRLWDMMIAVDDPAFTFFIGMCLLRRLRDDILRAEPELIPELASRVALRDEEDVDTIMKEALVSYKTTPRCLCRALRLCCVSYTDLSPSAMVLNERMIVLARKREQEMQISSQKGAENMQLSNLPKGGSMRPETQNVINAKNDLDDLMASQSVRSCTMLSPMELVQSLAPFALNGIELADKSTDGLTMSTDDHGTASATTQIQESKSLTVQPFVVIDVRSAEESVESGAGMLPRAIQLEPSFLDRPDAFEVWLQHFDGTRGCHICVVDMPPAILPGVALWRRLLLGEGDGRMSAASTMYGRKGENQSMNRRESGNFSTDKQSPFFEVEEKAANDDSCRQGVRLARALHENGFPFVSLLDGGFPSLVEHLKKTRGEVEPIIINHDEAAWTRFLKVTGRTGSPKPAKKALTSVGTRDSPSTSPRSTKETLLKKSKLNDDDSSVDAMKAIKATSAADLTPLEVAELACRVAARLGHTHMEAILHAKLKELNVVKNRQEEKHAEVWSPGKASVTSNGNVSFTSEEAGTDESGNEIVINYG